VRTTNRTYGTVTKAIKKDDLLRTLPPEWPQDLRPLIKRHVRESNTKIVVLDDDPTGTQTVHGVPVLTGWSEEILQAELGNDEPAFYVLTNSRSLPLHEARAMNSEIGRRLRKAAEKSGKRFVVVSRSDSTLRGHFPGELEALAEGLSENFDAWIVIPFFLEGGRYTIRDTHYVDDGSLLIPAAETEFARDKVFGYTASDLRQWVEEKTQGIIAAHDVLSISLEDLREAGPNQVAESLMGLQGGRVCVVNAAAYRDLEVFVLGLLKAEAQGRRFIYRTAASFVQVRAGISPLPLLCLADLAPLESGGGLTIVGSHVPKTTKQLDALLSLPDVKSLEVDVETILDQSRRQAELERLVCLVDESLQRGETVVVYTSRRLVSGQAEENLAIGNRVSEALTSVVQRISTKPRYIIAKGGITASDVATKGLNIKRASVLGQILPGVPVWRLGSESRFPGIPYIVFPGNVGGPTALAEVVKNLHLSFIDPACGPNSHPS
jgi:uncharacterized protein YgbK (DUF1537 family)